MLKLDPRQVGRCGELLVQYWLLKYGVESSPLTTDTGIDLVAYSSLKQKPVLIQVKTSRLLGHTGNKWLRWQIPNDCPAEFIAMVDLDNDKFWLIRTEDFESKARRVSDGDLKLQWPFPDYESKEFKQREEQYKEHEMKNAIPRIFGLE